MPKQVAFRMNLFPGQAAEYRKRHLERQRDGNVGHDRTPNLASADSMAL